MNPTVSKPLKNTRSDGQWAYTPIQKFPASVLTEPLLRDGVFRVGADEQEELKPSTSSSGEARESTVTANAKLEAAEESRGGNTTLSVPKPKPGGNAAHITQLVIGGREPLSAARAIGVYK
jgi:hypothetical protein